MAAYSLTSRYLHPALVAALCLGAASDALAQQNRRSNQSRSQVQERFDTAQSPRRSSPQGPRLGQSAEGIPTGPRSNSGFDTGMRGRRPNSGFNDFENGGRTTRNDTGRILGTIIEEAIREGARNQQQQSRPSEGMRPRIEDRPRVRSNYFPSEPEPTMTFSPSNSPPNTIPSLEVPANQPPANQLPAAPAPEKNYAGFGLTDAKDVDFGLTGQQVDQQTQMLMQGQLGQTEELLDGLILDDEAIKQMEKTLLAGGADPKDVKEFLDAVESGDTKKAEEILVTKGVDQGDIDFLKAQMEVTSKFNDLKDKVDSNASTADIKEATQSLFESLDGNITAGVIAPPSQQKLDVTIQTLDQIDAIADARQTLNDALVGNLSGNLPTDIMDLAGAVITVVNDPFLAAGFVVPVSEDVVVIGTGGAGGFDAFPGTIDDIGVAIEGGQAVADASGQPTADGIRLINQGSAQVQFLLNNEVMQLPKGYMQDFPDLASASLVFDRGVGNEKGEYSLEEGTYEFSADPKKGWDLFAKQYKVTIDNSKSAVPFNFLVGSQAESVPAWQTKELTDNKPIAVTFDRGDGGEPAVKQLEEGVYRVAVNPTTKLLDLFAGERVAATSKPVSGGRTPLTSKSGKPLPVVRPTEVALAQAKQAGPFKPMPAARPNGKESSNSSPPSQTVQPKPTATGAPLPAPKPQLSPQMFGN